MTSSEKHLRKYGRNELLLLGKSLLSSQTTHRVPPDAWHNINELGLGTARSRPTRRGKRGGHKRKNTRHMKCVTTTPIFGLLNSRSIRNKSDDIIDHVLDHKLNLIALTETWLHGDDSDQKAIGDITPAGYVFHHVHRNGGRGGGVGFLCDESIKLKLEQMKCYTSFEAMQAILVCCSITIRLIILYRVPPSQQNCIKRTEFLEEFKDLLEILASTSGKLLIMGDFNIHWNSINEHETKELSNLLSSYNLLQHVNESTHRDGHIIDFVISREEDDLVRKCTVSDQISDHNAVHAVINCIRPHPPRKQIVYRDLKNINTTEFVKDIQESKLYTDPETSIENSVIQYNSTMTEILDKHAPLKCKFITERNKRG